jgi:hypothetical protein
MEQIETVKSSQIKYDGLKRRLRIVERGNLGNG